MFWAIFQIGITFAVATAFSAAVEFLTGNHEVAVQVFWGILAFTAIVSLIKFFAPKLGEMSGRVKGDSDLDEMMQNEPTIIMVSLCTDAVEKILKDLGGKIHHSRRNGGITTVTLPRNVQVDGDILTLPNGDLLRISYPHKYGRNRFGDIPYSRRGFLHQSR
ncbi:hypothetical protein HOI18_05535 [Candidatus Uhrbacteria bacterium]|nr:hypothetical protein [Candidatus Uhrbacteria bacterium]